MCIAGGKLNIFALRKAVGVVCLAKGASLAHSRLARGEQSQIAWPVKHFGVLWEECCMKTRSCCSLLLCRNIVINIWGMDPLGGWIARMKVLVLKVLNNTLFQEKGKKKNINNLKPGF